MLLPRILTQHQLPVEVDAHGLWEAEARERKEKESCVPMGSSAQSVFASHKRAGLEVTKALEKADS